MASAVIELEREAAPISLYFALEQGRKADMEVAARSAIAFAEAIRELAVIFDPFADVRVELASGTESSLGLNGLIRSIRGFPGSNPGWFAFLVAVAINISGDVRAWAVDEVMEWMTGKDAPAEVRTMAASDRHAIAQEVIAGLRGRPAKQPTQQIFKEARRDPAIIGVGVTSAPRQRPDVIVSREQFVQASGETQATEADPEFRTVRERLRVTVKKLRLEAIVASWRFQYGSLPEFSAEMRDKAFLHAFEEGRIELPLKIGAEMDIELETEQHFEGGVWVIKSALYQGCFHLKHDRHRWGCSRTTDSARMIAAVANTPAAM
jgi:hypothetical protein